MKHPVKFLKEGPTLGLAASIQGPGCETGNAVLFKGT